MVAGDGTAEQSRLAAERVQRFKRQLDQAERATKSWDEGAVGERNVADQLSRLIPHGWFLLHDVHWPGRPKAILEHVLVGPGGVVVVDTKNWTGEVRVSAGVLWQGRFARTQSVEGALAQCAVVASVLVPAHRRFVRPLICLAGQPELFAITNADVAVAGADRVVDAVLALPPVLDQQTVVGLYEHLGRQLTEEPAAESPALKSLTVHRAGGTPPVGGPGVSQRPAARPGPRQLPPGSRGRIGSAGLVGPGGGRKSSAQQQAAAGMGRLLCLAGFVILAVYVLPYWGG
ncbi:MULTISPECIES: nuclease-related domain-containing protein [unclassified Arthrobacter]|uniref:nuclease-related domain-containing protein n=1 Tax=unclassified Arthrobacter TaxID=235627 RepID=UPI00339956FB